MKASPSVFRLIAAGGVAVLLNVTANYLPPNVAGPLLKWGWFAVLIYLTWLLLSLEPIKRRLRIAGGARMVSYVVVGCIGAVTAIAYWAIVNEAYVRMSRPQTPGTVRPLEIIYDPAKCDAPLDNPYRGQIVHHQAFCIIIHNRTDQTIKGIQVKLDRVEPDIPKLRMVRLHHHGDNPPTFDDYEHYDKYRTEFTLTRGAKQAVDTVYTDSRQPETSLVQHVDASDITGKQLLPDTECILFITVSAEDVEPFTETFKTYYDSKSRSLAFWQYQSKPTQGQTESDALTNVERAQLMFERITVHGIREIVNSKRPEGTVQISYRMRNRGRTPGRTTNITFELLISERFFLPKPPVYDNPTTTQATYTVYPDSPLDTIDNFEIQNFTISLNQAKGLLECRQHPCRQYLFVYGFIEYIDVFERPHHSPFAYWYRVGSMDDEPVLDPVGFPEHWAAH